KAVVWYRGIRLPLLLTLPPMSGERLIKLVGRRAKELRRRRGLTQEDMMSHGFERRYYQRIEAGKVNLSIKSLNKLARAFGVEPSELLRA
ncbi:MAG TPA: helix-turn-helix transcriptional regulator, partial [Terriglobia bacterium]|nr:helix-turn-helix transcriptional regulator [Terriglobia bacterium]